MSTAHTGIVSDSLLLSGADVLWTRDALRNLARAQRSNGVGVPARVQHLLELTEDVASRVQAGAAIREAAPVPAPDDDLVDSLKAAALAGCGDAWIRVQCRAGKFATARKVGGRWLISRAELASSERF